jgi:chemotaxis protein MotA
MKKTRTKRTTARRLPLDLGALLVAPLGVAILFAAQLLAGVPVRTLLQYEAALIVFGGTLAALLVTYPLKEVLRTLRAAAGAFRVARHDLEALAGTMVMLAYRAHRQGLVAIDADAETLDEPFLREGLAFAIDESSEEVLREVLAADAAARVYEEEAPARMLEAAAGYAPTLGILGAVLGLIHVMRNLAAAGSLGTGMAVAFVATVYGVGAANLILLPLAGRLRERAGLEGRRRELMTVGICAIHQRLHPRVLARKLRSFGVRPDLESTRARLAEASRGSALHRSPAIELRGRPESSPAEATLRHEEAA